jgi:hypothetical protein
MVKIKPDPNSYNSLYIEMEQQLAEGREDRASSGGNAQAIMLVQEKIAELREKTEGSFGAGDGEIYFFREVWPKFHARLFYFQLVQRFESQREGLSPVGINALICREEAAIARFFKRYQDLWQYYRSRLPLVSAQFTREYSRSCLFDPLSQVLDPGWATLASYRVAWGLAYEEFIVYLRREAEGGDSCRGRRRYEWKESKSAAVELIKSQAEAGSIFINGKPATTAQLKADFEKRYQEDLKDFDKLLYATDTRKLEATPYLMKLVDAFMDRKKRLRK